MALGLLASAAVLFHVGATDAFGALAYGGRIVGVIFMTAALVEVVAVLALCDYWGKRALRYSGVAVLLGVGTVTVTDLVFLIVQFQGRDYTPFLWLWIGLALWAFWAFWTLTRQKVWRGIPHPKGVAMSVVVSGAIGLASVGYSQLYVPYASPTKMPFNVAFGQPAVSADGSLLHVPVHFKISNPGLAGIFVAGSFWVTQGYVTKFNSKGSGMSDWKRDLGAPGGPQTLRHVTFSPSRMLGAGHIWIPGVWVLSGAESSSESIIDVPLRSGLGRIAVFTSFGFVRGDKCKPASDYGDSLEVSWDVKSKDERHTRDAPSWLAYPGDEFLRYHAEIYHSSEMLNLTHSARYLNSWWVIPRWREGVPFAKGDTLPYMYAGISRDPEATQSPPEGDLCGMYQINRKTEATVAQLLKAAKR